MNDLVARAVAGDAAARAIVAQSSEHVLPGEPKNTADFLLGFAMGVQRQKHADFIRLTAMAANMRTKAQMEAVMAAARRVRDLAVVTVEVVPDAPKTAPAWPESTVGQDSEG
jgi:mannose-1-phosphate guanylyltransferase